jgi:hypothetical protein
MNEVVAEVSLSVGNTDGAVLIRIKCTSFSVVVRYVCIRILFYFSLFADVLKSCDESKLKK